MNETLSIAQCQNWLFIFSNTIIQISNDLDTLDAATGDGEHGSNLSTGSRAILKYLASAPAKTLGKFFEDIGMTIVNNVGGASGALYGTLFLRLGELSGNVAEVDLQTISTALSYARDGIVELGRVKTGDKTLLDALDPAVETLLESASSGACLHTAISNARIAADLGRERTASLVARKGRGSYQGERSIGHIDPGATSMAKLFESLEMALQP